jgi:hypothetical protein
MVNHELNKRLLKRANYYDSLVDGSANNEAVGGALFHHAQNLANLEPSNPAFKEYLRANGISYETGASLYQLGQLFLSGFRDPNLQDAMLSGNHEALKGTALGKQIEDHIARGFTIPGFEDEPGVIGGTLRAVGVPWGKATNPERIDAVSAVAGRTPSGSDFFDSNGNLKQPDNSWTTGAGTMFVDGVDKRQLAKLRTFRDNPHLKNKVRDQFTGQIIKGMGQSFNRQSPLIRSGVSHLGTRYLENKINEWAPKGSGLGGAFNSFGHWLLKLLSSMPGYESIMNWIADWKYGDKFKALPGHIQDYGTKSMYPQSPSKNNLTSPPKNTELSPYPGRTPPVVNMPPSKKW